LNILVTGGNGLTGSQLVNALGRASRPPGTPETKPLLPTSVYAVTERDHEELFLAVGTGQPTTIRRTLGFEAKVRLEDGIDEVIAFVRSRAPQDKVDGFESELVKRGLSR
jgi:hypothetical protein